MRYYKLFNKEAVLCSDKEPTDWSMESRRVALTKIQAGVEVSTVFLLIDHSFDDGLPLLFETMVFGGELDGELDRYGTWDEAVDGHNAMVKRVQEAIE